MKKHQAKKLIEEAGGSWDVFIEWMTGQTMALDEDGETDFYDCDVKRFIRYKCNPNNEPLDEWD